jgi:hypothetical protein
MVIERKTTRLQDSSRVNQIGTNNIWAEMNHGVIAKYRHCDEEGVENQSHVDEIGHVRKPSQTIAAKINVSLMNVHQRELATCLCDALGVSTMAARQLYNGTQVELFE